MKRPCHARRLDTRGILWKGFSKRSGRASVSWSALSLYFIKIPLSTTGYGRDPTPWWRVERKSLEIRQKRMRLFLKTEAKGKMWPCKSISEKFMGIADGNSKSKMFVRVSVLFNIHLFPSLCIKTLGMMVMSLLE